MSTQHTNSIEPDIAIAADLPAKSGFIASSIPPELFKHILAYVGDEARLGYNEHGPFFSLNPDARREEIKHLSACALTCVFWAQLTRERMFRRLILHLSEDMYDLLSLLRAPQSPRIPPICDILRYLDVFYSLGDHPWFHNLTELWRSYQLSHLNQIKLYITGPARSALVAASIRGSVLHPLFFAAPRVLPVMLPRTCELFLYIRNIHLPNPTVLSNLFQDCFPLRPQHVECTNLTWDLDPALQATPSSIGLKYTCRTIGSYCNHVSVCTDDILVAAMLESIPHHEFFQRRQGPYLDALETSCLFDLIRSTWHRSSIKLQQIETFQIFPTPEPDVIPEDIAARLPTGTDFCINWCVGHPIFRCIASRLPHAAPAGNNVRMITYIIIDLQRFCQREVLKERMKTVKIDWDLLLHTAQQCPHLRHIAIHHGRFGTTWTRSRQTLVAFLAHLGEAWLSLDELLELYYNAGTFSEPRWVQLQLDTIMMDEIKQTREEMKAEADAERAVSNEPESSVVEKGSESSAHTGNE